MRLQILSDLHVDANTVPFDPVVADGVDALIVAGDVREGIEAGFAWLRRYIAATLPIVMVAGNHEYYGYELRQERAKGRRLAAEYGITLLDNATACLGQVRFVGTTLWTDYYLFGHDLRADCMMAAQRLLMDHVRIRWHGDREAETRLFRPGDALGLHLAARTFLMQEFARPHQGATVVVTHHAPHEKSVARRYAASLVTPAFVSDLADVIAAGQPALWVHGHTHTSFDYRVGPTRIVCNPRGYGRENPAFDPKLVIEVGG